MLYIYNIWLGCQGVILMVNLKMKMPKLDLIKHFEGLPAKIFTRAQIEEILSENREFWRLSNSTTVHSLINFMLAQTKLESVKFEFPNRNIMRYTWGKVPSYEIINSLKPDSYFTHYTAVYLYELTEQIPKTVYLNFEQSRKVNRDKKLEQSRIDAAFKRRVRVSNNIALYNDHKICILNGMYTGQLGVTEIEGPEGAQIRATNIERTLIDITVRPVYAGGVFEVLKAYRLAKGKVSVNKLAAMLKKLDYIYPYHQAIGFYLDKSGVYKESSIKLLRKFDMNYDFYLTYEMKDTSYSKKWRLYFPKGF